MLDHIEAHALTLYTRDNDRDWGKSITLSVLPIDDDVSSYREKFLIFKPGSSITLEKHLGYDEIWMANRAFEYIIEINGELHRRTASKYERVVIPRNTKHKIINTNEEELSIFEIQMGSIKVDDKQQFAGEDIWLTQSL